jgi:hypothetical protein
VELLTTGRHEDDNSFSRMVFVDTIASKGIPLCVSHTVCVEERLCMLCDGGREGLHAILAANACVFVIVARRCTPVTWMIQASHCAFIASWLNGSRLGSEDRVLDTCQLLSTYSKRSALTMKLSSPPSNSWLLTPTPFGCSTGDSGFFTTYSTYSVAQI